MGSSRLGEANVEITPVRSGFDFKFERFALVPVTGGFSVDAS